MRSGVVGVNDTQLWAAYLLGRQHGIEAMHAALPYFDPNAGFGLDQLRQEVEQEERRDD